MKAQNMKICAKNGKKISKIPYLSQKGQHLNIGILALNFEKLQILKSWISSSNLFFSLLFHISSKLKQLDWQLNI